MKRVYNNSHTCSNNSFSISLHVSFSFLEKWQQYIKEKDITIEKRIEIVKNKLKFVMLDIRILFYLKKDRILT